MTRLTETLPAPSTPLKALSTADVHAPHVMPSTLSVVVAMSSTLATSASEAEGEAGFRFVRDETRSISFAETGEYFAVAGIVAPGNPFLVKLRTF
jgi:hypothetical protein